MSKSKRKFLPGSLVYTGEQTKDTTIKHITYNRNTFVQYDKVQPLTPELVDWIVVEGLSNVDMVKELCNGFTVDSLVIEDILNVQQRTKFEVFDDYLFVVVRYVKSPGDKPVYDYMSILLFKDVIITFTEQEHPFIDDIILRIKNEHSLINKKHHDYLLYVILDMIVDESIDVYDLIHKQIIDLEQDILALDSSDQLTLYNIRKQLVFLRNLTSHLTENLTEELLDNHTFFEDDNMKYYDDITDHVLNLNTRVNSDIETIRHILDVYMNTMSNKMNQIMKTLTIFSAIFIPLSFIAGVFGMNFTNFPILTNPYGLLIFTLICIIIPVGMLTYFFKKGWFK